MWICPNCGRSFSRRNQHHFCDNAPQTIDEYISAQPDEAQPFLREVRDALRTALPEAQERISWSMPTYWKGHNIIHFACSKAHIGIYPGPKAVEFFAERLSEYSTNKGSIRIPYKNPLPLELISDIAKWCFETGMHP